MPEGHRHGGQHRVVVEPAAVTAAERDQHHRCGHGVAQLREPLRGKGGVGFGERHQLGLGGQGIQGRAHQIQVTVVAGHGGSCQGGDGGGGAHAVPSVRPGPAVMPSVPAPAEQAADHAVRADVVREDPLVRGGTLAPRADILLDPVPVARVACQDPRVEDEAGGCEVDCGVSRAHARVHRVGQPRVPVPFWHGRAVRQQPVKREAVAPRLPVQPGVVRPVEQAGAPRVRAVVWAADNTAGGVIVAESGIDIQLSESHGPLGPPGRVRHGQEVEQEQALALVEPVVSALVLAGEHAEFG